MMLASVLVVPRYSIPGRSSVYSTIYEPYSSLNMMSASMLMLKPISLPKAIFIRRGSVVSLLIAIALLTFFLEIRLTSSTLFFLNSFKSSVLSSLIVVLIKPSFILPLSSGVTTSSMFIDVTANEINVGGTFKSLNVPLIESFPPIDGICKSLQILNAPSNASNGFDHLYGSSFNFSKYSWNVNLALNGLAPCEAIFASDSTTA